MDNIRTGERSGRGGLAMNETKHTPTPWRVFSKNNVISIMKADSTGAGLVFPTFDEIIHWSGFDSSYFHVDAPANAGFIVDACNQHDRLKAQVAILLEVLKEINHMGGDERGGYCICPLNDGSAPDHKHSSSCADARAVIATVEKESTPWTTSEPTKT